MISKTFTPSYPAETEAEYLLRVAEGPKRPEHVMVSGGRKAIRGFSGPVPDQTPVTAERLRTPSQPWSARTQSAAAHERALARKTLSEQRIAEAIDRFRGSSPAGRLGLLVPDTIWPLLTAGMPRRAASVLVQRAHGKLVPDVPSGTNAQSLFPVRFRDLLEMAIGAPLSVQTDGRVVAFLPDAGMVRRRRGATLSEAILQVPGRRPVTELRADDLRTAFELYQQQVRDKYGRKYVPENDNPEFLTTVVFRVLARICGFQSKKVNYPPGAKLVLVFVRQDGTQVERDFVLGEHSKGLRTDARRHETRYKTLENVVLADLPALLARLSRPRKHSTAREHTKSASAQENPMAKFKNDDDFFRAQYQRGAYGAQAAIPAARRNPPKNSQAAAVMARAKVLQARGHSRSDAMRAAWREVKAQARSNPWFGRTFLPDTTQTRSSLVSSPVDYRDLTQTVSGLVPGPYSFGNPGMVARFPGECANCHQTIQRGQPIVDSGKRGPKGGKKMAHANCGARANPRRSPGWEDGWAPDFAAQLGIDSEDDFDSSLAAARDVLDAKRIAAVQAAQDQAQSAAAVAEQVRLERFRRAQEAASAGVKATGGAWGRSPTIRGPYAERYGQFSPTMTGGFQPDTRRNPRKARKSSKKRK